MSSYSKDRSYLIQNEQTETVSIHYYNAVSQELQEIFKDFKFPLTKSLDQSKYILKR